MNQLVIAGNGRGKAMLNNGISRKTNKPKQQTNSA